MIRAHKNYKTSRKLTEISISWNDMTKISGQKKSRSSIRRFNQPNFTLLRKSWRNMMKHRKTLRTAYALPIADKGNVILRNHNITKIFQLHIQLTWKEQRESITLQQLLQLRKKKWYKVEREDERGEAELTLQHKLDVRSAMVEKIYSITNLIAFIRAFLLSSKSVYNKFRNWRKRRDLEQ